MSNSTISMGEPSLNSLPTKPGEGQIYFTSPHTLSEALGKFNALAQRTDALLFLILLPYL